ncbi:sirohydrochlorin chelatase [Gordonia sp. VNQ95]|jgi:sirohydrochlorin ferrochelatase|uniref:sirohydrochlorin chelatase n=1 Tax=Gordonia TaxID=2053 RepID=UPI0032B61294
MTDHVPRNGVHETAPRAPIMVAHGTRSPHGVNTVARLAQLTSERIGATRVAFVDVLGPSPSELLSDEAAPAVVLPAFLSSGYHVRQDIPDHVLASGHSDAVVAANLGPDPVLADIMVDRLREAGARPGDRVVMAAAGSSDPQALAEVERAAAYLADRVHVEVPVGYIATARPGIADVVSAVSRRRRRVFIASYLLAPGLFHQKLHSLGASGVAAPLGADPRIADLMAARYRDACVAAGHRQRV